MKLFIRLIFLLPALLWGPRLPIGAQSAPRQNAVTQRDDPKILLSLRGRILDAADGEACVGAVLRCLPEAAGNEAAGSEAAATTNAAADLPYAVADAGGNYLLRLPAGAYVLTCSATGYAPDTLELVLLDDRTRDIRLQPLQTTLEGVRITAQGAGRDLRAPIASLESLSGEVIKKVPVLLGEQDIIKVIQLLPGVQSASEGSSAFTVRGGSPDQNLILFDQANLYNISHMMGFFSIFNSDAVEGMNLYKGDIPAQYGGRLSSLLEVSSKNGDPQFGVNGSVGLIASKLCVQGSAAQTDFSYLAAARRTYADLLLKLWPDKDLRNTTLNFYDLNGKARWRINENNYLSLTLFQGQDNFRIAGMGLSFSNRSATLRWTRTFSPKLFMNVAAVGSGYRYAFDATTTALQMSLAARIDDAGLRADFTYKPLALLSLQFGYSGNYQWFRPGDAVGSTQVGKLKVKQDILMDPRQGLVNAAYLSAEQALFEGRLQLRYGLRLNRFDAMGPTTLYRVDPDYNLAPGYEDGQAVPQGRSFYHTYGWEPRLGASWRFHPAWALKASYSKTLQYVHLLSFSSSGSPLEIWVPSNPTIKPQVAHQWAAGLFHERPQTGLTFSVEGFYKYLQNVMDFKEHPNLLLYKQLETELRYGTGRAYGLEFMAKKDQGRLTGWASYTYSRSFRTIATVNNNQAYSAPSDRPHCISLVGFYDLSRRLTLSLNWIYSTGQPLTLPEGRYWFENELVPVYTRRNAYRLPDYHRLDASATLRLGTLHGRYRNELTLSLYNVYARKNAWSINYRLRPTGENYLEMVYLFSVVPSLSWSFQF